jgi:SsrA-binding protein
MKLSFNATALSNIQICDIIVSIPVGEVNTMEKKTGIKIACENRKARHDYFIHETYEAGIALTGTEVKSLRAGKANLKDSYAMVEHAELIVRNLHISPYEQGNRFNHDPLRPRKLLMHRNEINRLIGQTKEKGYTLVPLKMYFIRGRVKVELGLATGKKLYDKRQDMAERDAKRDIDRALRDSQKN